MKLADRLAQVLGHVIAIVGAVSQKAIEFGDPFAQQGHHLRAVGFDQAVQKNVVSLQHAVGPAGEGLLESPQCRTEH